MLPDIVQEFEGNSGAEAVLPPALLFETEDASHQGEENDDDSDQDGKKENDDVIVKVSDFQAPHVASARMPIENFNQWRRTHRLLRNP